MKNKRLLLVLIAAAVIFSIATCSAPKAKVNVDFEKFRELNQ